MKQFYYAIQTILHGRGSNVTKVISLSLGLTVGILLFSQIAFEWNYERCYPEAERLSLVRGGRENLKTGEKPQWYDESLFAPLAEAARSDLPDEVEDATLVFDFERLNVFKDDVKLRGVNYGYADDHFFSTLGIEVLKGNPADLRTPCNVFVSERFVQKAFAGNDPVGQVLSLDRNTEITVRESIATYLRIPRITMISSFPFIRKAAMWAAGSGVGTTSIIQSSV